MEKLDLNSSITLAKVAFYESILAALDRGDDERKIIESIKAIGRSEYEAYNLYNYVVNNKEKIAQFVYEQRNPEQPNDFIPKNNKAEVDFEHYYRHVKPKPKSDLEKMTEELLRKQKERSETDEQEENLHAVKHVGLHILHHIFSHLLH